MTVLKAVGGLVGILGVAGAVTFAWASSVTEDVMTKAHATHDVDFPVPFPLTEAEAAELQGADPVVVASERAIERGKHLVEARYGCGECHGADFGGGVMVDDPALGRFLGPNLTSGAGSVTTTYTARDWDRIVRHGVKPDGTAAIMPAKDFQRMTDRELSDIVAYIRSLPPVDRPIEPSTLGPVGTILVATGKLLPSAVEITDHTSAHAAEPPDASDPLALGEHLVAPCVGCHGGDLAGGPILGGDPSWPPADNLTPAGLGGWTEADFVRSMRAGTSKDGTPLRSPMDGMARFAAQMTDAELHAMWTYLASVPARETRE